MTTRVSRARQARRNRFDAYFLTDNYEVRGTPECSHHTGMEEAVHQLRGKISSLTNIVNSFAYIFYLL